MDTTISKKNTLTKTIELALISPHLIKILHWENTELQRYYSVLLGKDILGDLILLRTWGSSKTKQHGEKKEIHNHTKTTELNSILRTIINTRKRNGYTLIQTNV